MQITKRNGATRPAAMNEPALLRPNLRLSPLALGTLLACGQIAAADAPGSKSLGPAPTGTTIVVQNCNNGGNGSLRAAVNAAQSGDTIDLTTLGCTKITLTTGAVSIAQNSLTLTGPGASQLSIDGGFSSSHFNRILDHSGAGTLAVNNLTLTDAKYEGSADTRAACISSSGTVSLNHTVVSDCTTSSLGTHKTLGGGIYAAKGIVLLHSTVSGNTARASSTGNARGGGIWAYGDLTMVYSAVTNNVVSGVVVADGGGILSRGGDVFIFDSVIARNKAAGFYGGMQIGDYGGGHSVQILNSTISENQADDTVGGLNVLGADTSITISNSTIAFNTAGNAGSIGAGFYTFNQGSVDINSTIIANNSAGGRDSDLKLSSNSLSGTNNLITQYLGSVPSHSDACPLIGPLGDRGGSTLTHELLRNSPALDAGNNSANNGNGFAFDQRGSGYDRIHGAQPDIGAFEDQGVRPTEIFSGGFEGRCR